MMYNIYAMSKIKYKSITPHSLLDNVKPGVDVYIKCNVNGIEKHVLYCRGDEAFSSKRREGLLKRNVKVLFTPEISSEKREELLNRNVKMLFTPNRRSIEREKLKRGNLYHPADNLPPDLLNNPVSGIYPERISYWVKNTVEHILGDEEALSNLLDSSHDNYTYTHSLNLAVLGLSFGKHIALSPHSLSCLGIGMVFHDLGKNEVPLSILNKLDNLTEYEFEIVKKHPEAGLKFLAENKNIEKESLEVLIQHHENYDGTGYPYGLAGKDIHIFGRISRIIDVYDAITSNKSYKIAKRPFAALAEMREKMLNCFDKELFKEFILFLGSMDSRKKIRTGKKIIL